MPRHDVRSIRLRVPRDRHLCNVMSILDVPTKWITLGDFFFLVGSSIFLFIFNVHVLLILSQTCACSLEDTSEA